MNRVAQRISFFISLLVMVLVAASANAKPECTEMTRDQMVEKTREVLASNKNITEEQRTKMMDLFSSTMGKMAAIRTDMTESKRALFKALMSKKDNTSKIRKIRSKLVKLNKSKMDTMFDSMEKAKTILGKNTSEDLFRYMDFDAGRGVY
jgi:Spy/CpxP family protein refolding chaperone